jgi:multidrug efflux pump subunit AcrA (membrane-fusion protein)
MTSFAADVGCGKGRGSDIVNNRGKGIAFPAQPAKGVSMFTPKRSLYGSAMLLLLALALLAACGDDEGPGTTGEPTQSPAGTSPAPSEATPTAAPDAPLTLEVSSISPDPANVGDEVTITFETQPAAQIGLQIKDADGQTVHQGQLTAGSDGTATFTGALQGPTGTWLVEAAAAATVQGLLALQMAPTPGPHSTEATFEMQ